MTRRPLFLAATTFAALGLVAGCSDDGSVEVADDTTTTAAGASTTTIVRPSTSVLGDGEPAYYLEETRPEKKTVTLVLHRGDGSVVRDAYTTSTFVRGDDPAASPIMDAEVTADGEVYVVERTATSEQDQLKAGGTRLAKVAEDGTATTVKENVTASELSPDGTRMAVAILSPDGDGNGSGTRALRVIDLGSGATEELYGNDVAVDADGVITQEYGRLEIVAWIDDQKTLVVTEGCCDSGSVSLVPSTAAAANGGSFETWPAIYGDHATYALGTDDGDVLVQRNTTVGDGVDIPIDIAGIEVVALDPDTPGPNENPVQIYSEPPSEDKQDRARFDLIGGKVAGTPFPIAFEGGDGLFGASDETTPRRFI